ncbi:hypothetical protein FLA_3014 [Filimonas lacunae]|nr:hypothetical protein FLA_3014 [Filimonas lacunae]
MFPKKRIHFSHPTGVSCVLLSHSSHLLTPSCVLTDLPSVRMSLQKVRIAPFFLLPACSVVTPCAAIDRICPFFVYSERSFVRILYRAKRTSHSSYGNKLAVVRTKESAGGMKATSVQPGLPSHRSGPLSVPTEELSVRTRLQIVRTKHSSYGSKLPVAHRDQPAGGMNLSSVLPGHSSDKSHHSFVLTNDSSVLPDGSAVRMSRGLPIHFT